MTVTPEPIKAGLNCGRSPCQPGLHCIQLGLYKNLQLKPGDGIVLYTDGVTEAENPNGEQYDLDRLCKIISRNWTKPTEAIKDAVVFDVCDFIDVQTIYDDLTLLVVMQK